MLQGLREDICHGQSGSVPQRLIFKGDSEEFLELIENEGVVPAPYVGRYKWVMLEA
jgi:Protein of unknown function (DUF419).